MKSLEPRLVIGPNHPLRTGFLVSSVGSRPNPLQSPTKPEGDSSLTAEQKVKLEEMKAAYVVSQHKASLEAQSGSKEIISHNNGQ